MRWRRTEPAGEGGFTLVEMIVAITLLASSLLALAHLMYGSMKASSAAHQRSIYLELATKEMEVLRARPWAETGVGAGDPDFATAYPGGKFDGRDAVLVASGPAAVSVVPGGVTPPYTARRWVTVGPAGPGASMPRRLDVDVEWLENQTASRHIRLTSIRYPGGLGAGDTSNTAPSLTASAVPGVGIVAGTTSVAFTAVGNDVDGDTLAYTWSFGDGISAVGASTSHVYTSAVPITVTATVTVTDGRGGSAVATIELAVSTAGSNEAPTASFTHTPAPEPPTAPFVLTFDGVDSLDPDGDPLVYVWNWGDGSPNGSGVQAAHEFLVPGSFTVTLTVSDPTGATGTATVVVEALPLNCDVTGAYFKNPSANATNNRIVVTGSNKPVSTGFLFRATSNAACTGVTVDVPSSGGTFTTTLASIGLVNGVRTWEATSSVGAAHKFNLGASQTAQAVGTLSGQASDSYQFGFQVTQ